MSRFGIRKRVKSALGRGTSSTPEVTRFTVTYVLPDGSERRLEAEEGYTVLMAADAAGLTISTGRRAGGPCPDGLCDLCRVEVIVPTGLSPQKPFERKSMADHVAGLPHEGNERAPGKPPGPNTRLGCHTKIVGSGGKVKIARLFDPTSIEGE